MNEVAKRIPYSTETKQTTRAGYQTQTLLRARKKLVVVRGLPGSGKTNYCHEMLKASFLQRDTWVHLEVDNMYEPPTVENIASKVIEMFNGEVDVVLLDGIFVESQVILSIYTRVRDAVHGVGLDIVTPNTEWADNPYQCWMKTVERAAGSHPDDSSRRKLVPLNMVMDLWKRWEDVQLSGVSSDT